MFSDFIIYADESGSPVLAADAADFPIFVLVFLIVRKEHYSNALVPKVQMLKFDFVGHDQIVLHERDIRRQSGAFAFLQVSRELREKFMDRLSAIMAEADIRICCAIIDKAKLAEKYALPWSPYDLALTFCMEKAAKCLRDSGEHTTDVNVVFEARGPNEDRHLELEFRRIADGKPRVGNSSPIVPGFSGDKCSQTSARTRRALRSRTWQLGRPVWDICAPARATARVTSCSRRRCSRTPSASHKSRRATEIPQQPNADRKTPAHLYAICIHGPLKST